MTDVARQEMPLESRRFCCVEMCATSEDFPRRTATWWRQDARFEAVRHRASTRMSGESSLRSTAQHHRSVYDCSRTRAADTRMSRRPCRFCIFRCSKLCALTGVAPLIRQPAPRRGATSEMLEDGLQAVAAVVSAVGAPGSHSFASIVLSRPRPDRDRRYVSPGTSGSPTKPIAADSREERPLRSEGRACPCNHGSPAACVDSAALWQRAADAGPARHHSRSGGGRSPMPSGAAVTGNHSFARDRPDGDRKLPPYALGVRCPTLRGS